jgi:hypothetical protein
MKGNSMLLIGGLGLVLLLCLMLCLPVFAIVKTFCGAFDMLSWFTHVHCPDHAKLGVTGPSQPGAWDIVDAALGGAFYLCPADPKKCKPENHLNYYDPNDQRVVELPFPSKSAYFSALQAVHLPEDPPNYVECVGFAETIYKITNHQLPKQTLLAKDYWKLFQNVQGWQEIPNGVDPADAPLPGDLVIWDHTGEAGHMAIVVATTITLDNNAPDGKGGETTRLSGSVYVAQGNAAGNYITKANDPLFPFPVPEGIHLLKLDYGPNKLETTWQGYNILGFLENTALVTSSLLASGAVTTAGDVANLTIPKGLNSPYVAVAEADALKYGYNPILFVRQINQESGFSTSRNEVSSAGAVGIAQFLPSTAAAWGVDPWDPNSALDGAARMMASAYKRYLGTDNSPANQILAYKKALAAYNCGGGCVASRVRMYGSDWELHLPSETKGYIKAIMGTFP